MDWILVDEKEPEIGQAVIFGVKNITDLQNRLQRPMVSAGNYLGEGKFLSWLTKDILKATHWQPMPELQNG